MEHWQLAYLGMRQIPDELNEFELATFFTFSRKERGLVDARRTDLYRLGVGLHIGFVRMTGRTLDAYKQIPISQWGLPERLALTCAHDSLICVTGVCMCHSTTLCRRSSWP